jgi:Serine phosphatase RsbU, regulator of sigma subunit
VDHPSRPAGALDRRPVDARNEAEEPFGEERLLSAVCARRTETPEAIVRAVLAEAEAFGSKPIDDRTLLILRI